MRPRALTLDDTMDRGNFRLNALLIAVAASLGVLIGIVGAARREPGSRGSALVLPVRAPEALSARVPVAASEVISSATEPADEQPPAAAQPATPSRARVVGFVFHLDGSPAEAARVLLCGQEERADAEGRFELSVLADPARADLVAFVSGYEPALRPAFGGELVPGTTYEVRLVLGSPTTTVSGHVLDHDGNALKNWNVELDGPDPLAELGLRERVRTDSEGAFTLIDVPAGVHILRAWKERRELGYLSAPIEAGASGTTVVVPAGAH